MSNARVVLIMGPRMSGKTSASIMKLFKNALEQKPAADGWIRRRSYIIRRTFDELKRTTIKSWQNWMPESKFGPVKMSHPPTHHIVIPNQNGPGGLDWEVIFLALDKEEDVRKLNSSECSDAWVNETWEVARNIIGALMLTVGRYPNPRSEEGCHNPQVILDTNGPPLGHWINYMCALEAIPPDMPDDERKQYQKPDNWDVFVQPPGLTVEYDEDGRPVEYLDNPKAENIRWIAEGYYSSAAATMTPGDIARYLMGRPGSLNTGKVVWHQFREDVHVPSRPLLLIPGHKIIVGMDFGRTPAAAICQKPHEKIWRVVGEVEGIECSVHTFANEWLSPALARAIELVDPDLRWEWEVIIYGDPAGSHQAEAVDTTAFRELIAAGYRAVPARAGERFLVRQRVMNEVFRRLCEGQPEMQISPTCKVIIRAANSGYCYPRVRTLDGQMVLRDSPDKRNRYSHIANALEYAITGHDKIAAITEGNALPKQSFLPHRPQPAMQRMREERRSYVIPLPPRSQRRGR